jgi:hypothetical protein
MNAPEMNSPVSAAQSPFVSFGDQPEEEQIAQIIKLFSLPPVLSKSKAIWATGDNPTAFYGKQDPKSPDFDPLYPAPIGGRRSGKAPRNYWTVDILRWKVRNASRTSCGGQGQ